MAKDPDLLDGGYQIITAFAAFITLYSHYRAPSKLVIQQHMKLHRGLLDRTDGNSHFSA